MHCVHRKDHSKSRANINSSMLGTQSLQQDKHQNIKYDDEKICIIHMNYTDLITFKSNWRKCIWLKPNSTNNNLPRKFSTASTYKNQAKSTFTNATSSFTILINTRKPDSFRSFQLQFNSIKKQVRWGYRKKSILFYYVSVNGIRKKVASF